MTEITITTSVTIPEERIKDLLCNALEGGANYWYKIEGYNYPEGTDKASFKAKSADFIPYLDLPFK